MAYDFRHRLHFYKNGTEYNTGLCTSRGDISGSYQSVLGVQANGTTYYAPIQTTDIHQLPLAIGWFAPNYYHLVQNRLTISIRNRLSKQSIGNYHTWRVTVSCDKGRTEDLDISVGLFRGSATTATFKVDLTLETLDTSISRSGQLVSVGSGIWFVEATVTGYGRTWQSGRIQLDVPSSGSDNTDCDVTLF